MLGALGAIAIASVLFGALAGLLALLTTSTAQPWRTVALRILLALYFAATLPPWALAWYCFCGSNHDSLLSFLSATRADRGDSAGAATAATAATHTSQQ